MRLSEAIELVLDEAETSALGDLSENENSQEVIKALKIVRKFVNWEGQDIQLWEKEWRRRSIQKHSTEANVDFPLPTRLKGKLYRLCCRERNTLFYNKLEEL